MKKVIRLTESDIVRLVNKVIKEQDIIGMANQILTGFGDSDKKVKEFCDLCKKSKAQPTPRANRFADVIRNAVQGVGTNEEAIYHVFDSLEQQANDGEKFDEFCSLVKAYQQSYNVDLHTDLSADISDESEWARIMRPIRDLLTLDSYKKTSSRDGGQSNQKTTSATRPSVTPSSGKTYYDERTNSWISEEPYYDKRTNTWKTKKIPHVKTVVSQN